MYRSILPQFGGSVHPLYDNEVSYDYDENGNLTKKEEITRWAEPGTTTTVNRTDVTYTVENLPKVINTYSDNQSGSPPIEADTQFLYDPSGRRIRKYTYAALWETYKYYISEGFEVTRLPGANAIVDTNYIFAGNQRVAKVTDGEVVYIHKDHLGSTTVITDTLGNPDPDQPLTQYRPYGLQRADSELSTKTDYGFTDQEFDKTTGFYNYDARLYNPEIGMFNTPDSLLQNMYDPQLLNRYAYVRNNPLKYIDPSGNLSVSTHRYAKVLGNPAGAESGKKSAENAKKTTGEETQEITVITPTTTYKITADANGNIISKSDSPTLYAMNDTSYPITPFYTHKGEGSPPSTLQRLQIISDTAAGFGDTISMGATKWIRSELEINESVNSDSGAYLFGQIAGVLHSGATGVASITSAVYKLGSLPMGAIFGNPRLIGTLGVGPGMLPYKNLMVGMRGIRDAAIGGWSVGAIMNTGD